MSTEQGPMEARVGVLPSSSVGTVSDAILQRDGEGCRSMELGCTDSTQGTTSQ